MFQSHMYVREILPYLLHDWILFQEILWKDVISFNIMSIYFLCLIYEAYIYTRRDTSMDQLEIVYKIFFDNISNILILNAFSYIFRFSFYIFSIRENVDLIGSDVRLVNR